MGLVLSIVGSTLRFEFGTNRWWYIDRVTMLAEASSGKERLMTEGDRRTGSGGTEDNVRDELDDATKRGKSEKDASKGAVEEGERTAGTGGTKDNVSDEWEESQRH